MAKILGVELATRLTDPYQVAALLQRLPNPDPVLRKLGRDQRVYEAISYDPHVMGELRSIRAGLLGFEWRVVPGDDSRKARKAADLARELMDRNPAPNITWPDVIWTMAQAIFTGYAVHEIVWRRDGRMIVPEHVLDRPSTRFVFSSKDNSLRLLTRRQPVWGEELPDMRFLLSRHMPSFDNPHGVAVFSSCFWPYTFKHGGFRYFVNYVEKFGVPWVVGKYPAGGSKEDADELLAALVKLVSGAIGVIPENTNVEPIGVGGNSGASDSGRAPHERLITVCNAELSKALTSQTLATEIQGQGSRAATETHRKREQSVNQSDREIVSASLNRLYRWITDLNFGVDVPSPRHEFYEESQARSDWVKLLNTARHFLPISRDQAYERLGLTPPRDGEELLITAPASVGGGGSRGAPAEFAADGGDTDLYGRALEAAIAAADDPDQAQAISEDLARPLLEAADENPEMLLGRLAELYPKLDASKLQDLLGRALFVAEIWGSLSVEADEIDDA